MKTKCLLISLFFTYLPFLSVTVTGQKVFEGNIKFYESYVESTVRDYYETALSCLFEKERQGIIFENVHKFMLDKNPAIVADFLPSTANDGMYTYEKYIAALEKEFGKYVDDGSLRIEQDNFNYTHKFWTDDGNGLIVYVTFDNRFFSGDKLLYAGRTLQVVCFPVYHQIFVSKIRQVTPENWNAGMPVTQSYANVSVPVRTSGASFPSGDNAFSIPYPKAIDYNPRDVNSVMDAVDYAMLAHRYGEAHQILKEAQTNGHMAVLCYLGYMYLKGLGGLPVDLAAAAHYFKQAYNTGHPRSIYFMAFCHKNGIGTKEDAKEAVRLAKLAARQGDSYALNFLGNCYNDGFGVRENATKAQDYFSQAANKGNAYACYYLFLKYRQSIDKSVNRNVVLDYLVTAHKNGLLEASHVLIDLYRGNNLAKKYSYSSGGIRRTVIRGSGFLEIKPDSAKMIEIINRTGWFGNGSDFHLGGEYYLSTRFAGSEKSPDTLKAVTYYKQAVKQGHYISAAKLGSLLGTGSGVYADPDESARYFKLAADSIKLAGIYENDSSNKRDAFGLACNRTAQNYDKGTGMPRDPEKALYYARRGADAGFAYAKEFYAYLLMRDNEGDKNIEKQAFRLYESTAKAGSLYGLYQAGSYALKGVGTYLDITKGLDYLEKAAAGGYGLAFYRLGSHYLSLGKKDKAKSYFEKGKDLNDASSIYELGSMYYREIDSVPASAPVAFNLFHKAALLGLPVACEMTGVCYMDGIGTKADINEALRFLKSAAGKNRSYACYRLGFYYYNILRDIPTAKKYLEKGRATGDGLCSYQLGVICYNQIKIDKSNGVSAFGYFQEAYKRNTMQACKYLGDCFSKGIGTEKNLSLADKYYKLAAENGK